MSKLTVLGVKKAGAGRHGDGGGLYLVVSDTGSRKWVLRIQVNGKRRDIGLGSATKVGLSEAREAAEDMRRAIRRGDDPVAERRRAKDAMPTFHEAAVMVHKEHQPSWKNVKHTKQWLSTLEAYVFPRLGDLPVNQIDGSDRKQIRCRRRSSRKRECPSNPVVSGHSRRSKVRGCPGWPCRR